MIFFEILDDFEIISTIGCINEAVKAPKSKGMKAPKRYFANNTVRKIAPDKMITISAARRSLVSIIALLNFEFSDISYESRTRNYIINAILFLTILL